MNLPSVKTLMRIEGMEIDRAKLLRKVLETNCWSERADIRHGNPRLFAATIEWVRLCHRSPSPDDVKMSMANDIIDGCGVIYIGEVEMRDGPPLAYVNLGDTYDCTLCRFRGRYVVSSWGDIVERHEQLFRDW